MKEKKKLVKVIVKSSQYVEAVQDKKRDGYLYTYRYSFDNTKGEVLARHRQMKPFKPGTQVVVTPYFKDKDGIMHVSVADPVWTEGENMMTVEPSEKIEEVVETTATYEPQTVEAEHSVTLGPNDSTTGNVVFANDYPAEITAPQSYIADGDLKLAGGITYGSVDIDNVSSENVLWDGATTEVDLGNVPDIEDVEGVGSVDTPIEIGTREYEALKKTAEEFKAYKHNENCKARYRRKTDERIEFEIEQKADARVTVMLEEGDRIGAIKVSDTRRNALELATYGFAGRGDMIDPEDVTQLADVYYNWLLGGAMSAE